MSPKFPKHGRIRLGWEAYRQLCQEVLRRDGWRCQMCGKQTNLQVHHMETRGRLGSDAKHNLITLCCNCHGKVHTNY